MHTKMTDRKQNEVKDNLFKTREGEYCKITIKIDNDQEYDFFQGNLEKFK